MAVLLRRNLALVMRAAYAMRLARHSAGTRPSCLHEQLYLQAPVIVCMPAPYRLCLAPQRCSSPSSSGSVLKGECMQAAEWTWRCCCGATCARYAHRCAHDDAAAMRPHAGHLRAPVRYGRARHSAGALCNSHNVLMSISCCRLILRYCLCKSKS